MSSRRIETHPVALAAVLVSAWWGFTNVGAFLATRDPITFAYAIVGIAGAFGFLFRQSWSQYCYYFATLIFGAWWLFGLYQVLIGEIRYDTGLQTFFGLLIAFVPTVVAVLCSLVAYRYFREPRHAD